MGTFGIEPSTSAHSPQSAKDAGEVNGVDASTWLDVLELLVRLSSKDDTDLDLEQTSRAGRLSPKKF